MSQPHFGISVRVNPTLPRVGTWSPPGLLKTQSSSSGVETPLIGLLFIPLERCWSVDVQNGLAWAIWTSAAQVMGKRRESTSSRCLQRECDMELESSWRELQLWFKPRPDPSSGREVMEAQSPRSPIRDSFGTPPWESREKKPFGCSLRVEL
jgi:hypothetical protein